jgi:hypothetical protein
MPARGKALAGQLGSDAAGATARFVEILAGRADIHLNVTGFSLPRPRFLELFIPH